MINVLFGQRLSSIQLNCCLSSEKASFSSLTADVESSSFLGSFLNHMTRHAVTFISMRDSFPTLNIVVGMSRPVVQNSYWGYSLLE
jgi:hypothetical protein